MDYFGARYYASVQGRFTSPDPFSIIQMRQSAPNDEKTRSAFMQFIGDPRRWNRFAYAVNSPLVFTDKTGLDIMIIENHATDGNPTGHTAIAITGKGLWSFGNADRGRVGERSTEFHDIVRGDVKDYIIRELPRRDTTIFIIKTTEAQDNAAAGMLDAIAGSGKTLTRDDIASDNCSTRVNKALDAAGIEGIPISSVFPGTAGVRAVSDPAVGMFTQVTEITKNSNLTKTDLDKIKPFEARASLPQPGQPGGTPVITMPMRKRPGEED